MHRSPAIWAKRTGLDRAAGGTGQVLHTQHGIITSCARYGAFSNNRLKFKRLFETGPSRK
jgi:hypothetical protein